MLRGYHPFYMAENDGTGGAGGATFTQADIDKARSDAKADAEKEWSTKEQTIRGEFKEFDSYKTKLGEAEAKLKTYEEQLNTLNESASKGKEALSSASKHLFELVPEEKRGLIPESMGDAERVAYIKTNWNLLIGGNAPTVKTPPPEDKGEAYPSGGGYGPNGEYSSIDEFEEKDPKGFLKACKAGKI